MARIDELNELSTKLNAIVDEFYEGLGLDRHAIMLDAVRYLLSENAIHISAGNRQMEQLLQGMKDIPFPQLIDLIAKADEKFTREVKEIAKKYNFIDMQGGINWAESEAEDLVDTIIGDYRRAFSRFMSFENTSTTLNNSWYGNFLDSQASRDAYKIRSVVPESFAARSTAMFGESLFSAFAETDKAGITDTSEIWKRVKKYLKNLKEESYVPETTSEYLTKLKQAKGYIKEATANYLSHQNNPYIYNDFLQTLDDNWEGDEWTKTSRHAATIPQNFGNKHYQLLDGFFPAGWSGVEVFLSEATKMLQDKYKGKMQEDLNKDPIYKVLFEFKLEPNQTNKDGKIAYLETALGPVDSNTVAPRTTRVKKAVVNELIGIPSANQMADDWSDIYNFVRQDFPEVNKFQVFLKDDRIEGKYLEVFDLYRGQGTGTAVIDKVIEFADKYELPIFIEPQSDVGDITKFYEGFGFTNESELLEFPGKTSYVREPTTESNLNIPKDKPELGKEDKVMQLLDDLKEEYGQFLDDTQSEAGDGSGLHFDLTANNVLDKEEIYVEALYIKPDKQGFGIGTEIVDKLKKLSNDIDVPITLIDFSKIKGKVMSNDSFWSSKGFTVLSDDDLQMVYYPKSDNPLMADGFPVRPDHANLLHEPQDYWEVKVDNLNKETATSMDHALIKDNSRIQGAANWLDSNTNWISVARGYADDINAFNLGKYPENVAELIKRINDLAIDYMPGGLGWKTYRDKYDPFNRFWNVIQMNNRKLGGVDNFTPHWHYEIQAAMIDLATHGYDDIFVEGFIDKDILSEIQEKVKKYDEFANNGVYNQQKRYASNFITGGSLVDNVVFAAKLDIPIPARIVFDYIVALDEHNLNINDIVNLGYLSQDEGNFIINNLYANVGGVDTFHTTDDGVRIPFGIGGSSPYFTKGNKFISWPQRLKNWWSKKQGKRGFASFDPNTNYPGLGYLFNKEIEGTDPFDETVLSAQKLNAQSHVDNPNGVGAAGANEFAYDLDITDRDMNYLIDESNLYRQSLGRSDKLKHIVNANSVVLPALNNMIYNELADAKELTFQNNAHHVVNVDNIVASSIEGLDIDRALKVAIYKEARGVISDVYEALAQDTSNDLINYGDFTILSHESPAEVLEQVQDLNVYNIRSLEADINQYYDTFANLSMEGNAQHVAFIDNKGHTRVVRPGHAFLIATDELTGQTLKPEDITTRVANEIAAQFDEQLDRFSLVAVGSDDMYLSELYVKPEYQQEGVGRKIMSRLIEHADYYGMNIQLEPDPGTGNWLKQWYEGLGFEKQTFFNEEGEQIIDKEMDNLYAYVPEKSGVATIRPVVPDMSKKTAIIYVGPGNQNFLDLGRTGFINALAGEDPGVPATQAGLEQAEELSKQTFNIKAVVDGEVMEFDALEGRTVFDQMREQGISNVIIDESLVEPLAPVRSTGDLSYLDTNIANPVSIIEDQPRNVNDLDDIIVLDDSAKIFNSEIDEVTMKPIEEAIVASRQYGQVIYQDPRVSTFVKPTVDNDIVNETAKALQDISRVALLDNLNSGDIADRFKAITGGAIGEIGGVLAAHAVGTDKAWKQSVMNFARSAAEPGPLGKQLEYIFEKGLYNAEWLAYRPFAAWWVSSGKSPKYFGQWLSKQNQLGESVVKIAQSTKAKGAKGIQTTMDILKKSGAGSIATRLGAGGLATLMIAGGQYAEKALYGKWLMDLTAYTSRKNQERQIANMQGMSLSDRKEFLQSDPTTFALITGISAGLTGQPTSMKTIRSLNEGINKNMPEQYQLDLNKDYGINWNVAGGKDQVIKDVVESQDQWLKIKADTTRMIKELFSIDKSKYVNDGTNYSDSNVTKHANFFGSFNRGIQTLRGTNG
tara:strand:+ start:332 stop:5911 length:5580 start_codon:yes stop_codon:yes gene_type:complete